MNISIPQIITGILSMFLGILGVRVIMPLINPIFGMTWNNSLALIVIKLVVYLVISFIIYVIIYGTVMGKAPNVLNVKKQNDEWGDAEW